jgi:hypothetical protein
MLKNNMKTKLTKILKFSSLTIGLISLIGLSSGPVYASPFSGSTGEVCNGAAINGTGDCTSGTSSNSINGILKTVLEILSWAVGIIAVIMIIIAGLRYITSGGDANGVNGAKNAILYAIVGIVIVAMAQIIVQFVLQKATQ